MAGEVDDTIPEVTIEELNRYLEENPGETFDMRSQCGCLLHNYLAKTRPLEPPFQAYEVDHIGVASAWDDKYQSTVIARLPDSIAIPLEKAIDKSLGRRWHYVGTKFLKEVIELAKGQLLEEVEAKFLSLKM